MDINYIFMKLWLFFLLLYIPFASIIQLISTAATSAASDISAGD